jgi:uncharacterized protein (TIGR02452 family)
MDARMRRSEAARLGKETVAILDAGGYAGPAGWVDLREVIANAVNGTRDYPAGGPLPHVEPQASTRTVFEVVNETTLAAAARLVSSHPVAALNFASAYHAGGGFLGGARAQEESLARSSALYACLRDRPMYAFHQMHRDPLYTDWTIHSADVPVFRRDDGELLAEPYCCTFITCAAVNAKVVLERDPSRVAEITDAMRVRIDKVLDVAALHGHRTLVLGAWGCGVFGNDPSTIARLFRTALDRFRTTFDRVAFAIVDWTDDERIIGPFRREFGG